MSKAVLVIDKPNCCGNCELIVSMYSEQYEEWYEICHITQKKIFDTEKIDKECPLKMLTDMTSMINDREDDYIKREDAISDLISRQAAMDANTRAVER